MERQIEYVDYRIKMSPYGIQFSDDMDKLTIEKLNESHGFEHGDKFVLYTDTDNKLCLKKVRD